MVETKPWKAAYLVTDPCFLRQQPADLIDQDVAVTDHHNERPNKCNPPLYENLLLICS